MYLEHFGLNEHPFKITPDLDFFNDQSSRASALKSLKYAVDRGDGIVKVVGDVGAGKTTLLRSLESLLSDHFICVTLLSPNLNPRDLLYFICDELNIQFTKTDSKQQIRSLLHKFLIDKIANGFRCLILVDEAQIVPFDSLEELRLLANMENNKTKLLQLLIFGQIELEQTLFLPSAKPFVSRISYEIYLNALSVDEVLTYINHRFYVSGYPNANFFSYRDAKKIHDISKGLPRKINQVCDKLLFSAYTKGKNKISRSDFSQFGLNNRVVNLLTLSMLILVVLMIGGYFYYIVPVHKDSKVVKEVPLPKVIKDVPPSVVTKVVPKLPISKVVKNSPKIDIAPVSSKWDMLSKKSRYVFSKIPKNFYTVLLFSGTKIDFNNLLKNSPILNRTLHLDRLFLIENKKSVVVFYGYTNKQSLASQTLKKQKFNLRWPMSKIVTLKTVNGIINAT